MIAIEPVATVHNSRRDLSDDDWGPVFSTIVLADHLPEEALAGIEAFSHCEVIFHFNRVAEDEVTTGARHPRGNSEWPKVGIFAQRGKNRPNRIGVTIVEIVEREGRELKVTGLDAVDGTPVIDIKPVMTEFLPRTPLRQPAWATELMCAYWQKP